MSHNHSNPLEHPEVRLASGYGYVIGFVVACGAMLLSLWLVESQILPPDQLIASISFIALVTVLVQCYTLFKLDLSKTQIWHTLSLVLTLPLFIMAVGLTVWMFHTLRHTMPHGMGG